MHSSQEIEIGRRMSWVRGRNGRAATGFTLIELMVAIAILAILIALTFGGVRMVGERMKGTATRQTLGSLKSMLADAEGQGLFKQTRQPAGVFVTLTDATGSWQAIRKSTSAVTGFQDRLGNDPPVYKVANFWLLPDVSTDAGTPAPLIPPSVLLDPVDSATWRDTAALRNTAMAIAILRTVPSIAKGMDALPPSTIRTTDYYVQRSIGSGFSPGARVIWADPSGVFTSGDASHGFEAYVWKGTIVTTNIPTGADDKAGWAFDWAAPIDAWGRPIIYVPATGLKVTVGGNTVTITAPDHKGFWASAGPDGRMDLGDDNVYSFD